VVSVGQWAEIRRLYFVKRLSIKEIVRRSGHGRNTIRRALRSVEPPPIGVRRSPRSSRPHSALTPPTSTARRWKTSRQQPDRSMEGHPRIHRGRDNLLHRWRTQYGGLKATDAKRLKELERENTKLKRMVADQLLEIDALKEIARGTVGTPVAQTRGRDDARGSSRPV
jgi:hypothetical protein